VRHGLGTQVEVLPLTMVNLLQRVNAGQGRNGTMTCIKNAPDDRDANVGSGQDQEEAEGGEDASTSDSKEESDEDEFYDSESNPLGQCDSDDEFVDPEFEELVNSEGPQGMLQLMLQEQTNGIMTEDNSDGDDYADWIKWSSDAEENMLSKCEIAHPVLGRVLSQPHKPNHDFVIPAIFQTARASIEGPDCKINEGCVSGHHFESETRWKERCERIKVDAGLDEHGHQQLWATLEKYKDVSPGTRANWATALSGSITLTQGFPPWNASPGRLSFWEEAEVKRQIDILVDLGKMRPSNSEYACRVTLPVKKDGSRRFCRDYRPLNAQTRRDMFPMPLVEDVIDQLGKSMWFTALDLQSGFWQICMAPEDMKKTALITKTGLYDWTVMPFELKNATSTFTRTMSEVFKDLGNTFLKVFVDDLNIHSETWDDHLRHLEAVLCKLREVNLKLNPGKCCFAAKNITFLGHVVSREGIQPDPGKVEAVLHFPTPRNVTAVRSFLGLTRYYRKYIKGYSSLVGPLFELTRKDVVFAWNVNCEQAYQALKAALVDAPVLTRPDFRRTFWLDVDWSPKGVGAILSQKEGKFERVVAYASKSLINTQRRFHPMEGECYALIWGIMHFKQYLHMKHFILRTDHKPLEWLATVSDTHGRRGRWVGMLQDFSFKILHRPGLKHMNADALSRNPIRLAEEDEDFDEEIRDIASAYPYAPEEETEFLCVAAGKDTEWMGIRRKD
jgi:hypothetical protein